MNVRIAAGACSATIDPLGAEAVDWQIDGRRLLWQADPGIWNRTSPVLFPIVGRARGGAIRAGNRRYPIGVHGFAAAARFTVAEQRDDMVRMELRDDPATRAAFPFGFALSVEYRVKPDRLTASFRITNPDAMPLPYAVGWHPGFALPFSGSQREGHVAEFEREEEPSVPVITADGLFSRSRRAVPLAARKLAIDDPLMAAEALCFIDARSRWLRLVSPDGAAIRMELEDFPHLALWNRPGAPFLSIEAWTGHGDPADFDGDIFDKPSMRVLAPGQTAMHVAHAIREALPG